MELMGVPLLRPLRRQRNRQRVVHRHRPVDAEGIMSDRMPGWIRVYRSMVDQFDRTWNDPSPFDCRSARLDLILLARFAPDDVVSDAGRDRLERGEFVASIRFLAQRWRWSKDRVA